MATHGMKRKERSARLLRAIAALLPPFVAFGVQGALWTIFQPYVWFLFYSAVFLSSWIGGRAAGPGATVVSVLLVWGFFVPQRGSFVIEEPHYLFPMAIFVGTGILFSLFHGRLRDAYTVLRRPAERTEEVARAHIAISEAVAGLPEASLDAVLETTALQAQALTGAQYAAVGVGGDPERPFEPWVAAGVPPGLQAEIGRPCRPVGTLGVVACGGRVVRLPDVRGHPAYRGVPPHHPEIRSFLGVSIRFRGQSVGNLYLGNKVGAAEFTNEDQRVAEMLAVRIGVAVETARLYRAEGTQRAWLQSVLDQLPEGVLLLDAEGRVAVRNRALLRLTRDETGDLDLRRPSGEGLPAAEWPSARAILHRETVVGAEFLLGRKDDRPLPALISAAPVLGPNGEGRGATMVVQDISPLKELERQREEWTSIVAHDLRQPVAAISFSAQVLAKLRGENLGEEAETVEDIRAAADRSARMIEDLLDASRIEARRLSIQRQAVELPSLVQAAIQRMPEIATRCELRVEGGAARPVWVDPLRIEQVLVNLLSNAAKYGEPGTRIPIEIVPRDDGLVVTVTNQGPGIPPDELPRMFQRFTRSRRAGPTAGLGLGLYICRGLIEAHGGRIWVESVPGATTGVHFTVPFTPAPSRVPDTSTGGTPTAPPTSASRP